MSNRELLIHEIGDLPEPVVGEVLQYVRLLKSKNGAEPFETALLSEAVLARDWLRPEEDEAWRDL